MNRRTLITLLAVGAVAPVRPLVVAGESAARRRLRRQVEAHNAALAARREELRRQVAELDAMI